MDLVNWCAIELGFFVGNVCFMHVVSLSLRDPFVGPCAAGSVVPLCSGFAPTATGSILGGGYDENEPGSSFAYILYTPVSLFISFP